MACSFRTLLVAALAWAAFAPAAWSQAHPTVWHALGIPQGMHRLRDISTNRRGNRPGLERKPPLKAIADPANLLSDVPAIKAAAEIKAQEDLAPQKIKAIKYLGQLGCGCYGGVAEALAAALDDCTEEVRYEAARALLQAITYQCDVCQQTCCTKELALKMYEKVYERDDEGCFLEPSERVRSVLAQVLMACTPDMRDLEFDAKPQYAPPPPLIPDVDPVPDPLRPQPDPVPSIRPPMPDDDEAARSRRSRVPAAQASAALGTQRLPPVAPDVQWVETTICGEVVQGKSSSGFSRVVFPDGIRPEVGTELEVYHEYVLGTEFAGKLVILDYDGAQAIAGPRPWDQTKVSRGDTVRCTVRVPADTAPAQPAMPQTPQVVRRKEIPAQPVAARKVPAEKPAAAAKSPAEIQPATAIQAAQPSFVEEHFARAKSKAAEASPTPAAKVAPPPAAAAPPPRPEPMLPPMHSPVFVAPGKVAPELEETVTPAPIVSGASLRAKAQPQTPSRAPAAAPASLAPIVTPPALSEPVRLAPIVLPPSVSTAP